MEEKDIAVKLSEINSALSHIAECQDDLKTAFSEFRVGIGKRVEDTETAVEVMKDRWEMLGTVAKWIFAPAVGAVVLAILGMVLMKK